MNELDGMRGYYVWTSLQVLILAEVVAGMQTILAPEIFGHGFFEFCRWSATNFITLTIISWIAIALEYRIRQHYQEKDNDNQQ
jgi:hypothetical protein